MGATSGAGPAAARTAAETAAEATGAASPAGAHPTPPDRPIAGAATPPSRPASTARTATARTAEPTAAAPVLLAVAHGSRDPAAARTVEALLDRARALRPGLRARAAYLELTTPALADALAAEPGAVAILPLLLSTGFHAAVDIPTAAAATRPDALLGRVLGPDPLLAEALHDRLRAAGWRPADAVVLAAAGSTDPAAARATEAQARLLADRLGGPVTVGYASAREPSVTAAVAAARLAGRPRVAVATYLLAPGLFQAGLAGVGADLVTAPLGAHDAVVRLLLLRYDQACSTR